MRGRHAAGGWSPFWRDIILRTVLALLLIAMVVFIWWLFSEDDLFTEAVPTTSVPETTATSEVMTTETEPEVDATTTTRPATTTATQADTTTSTTAAVTTTSTTTTVPPPLDPAQLVVRVLNANGVQGVAGRVSGRLEEAGYGVTAPDNHAQRLDVSRVWYRDDLSREAALVRDELVPDALVEAIPLEQEGIDIVVVLGRSFEE
ncbi:MAG: LytR C-terminal domain-containing protein [bacterium]|nr:LytR C-terminal domain-containing protein [bacterium]MDE0601238.1 LytR C-terminal domain-containing protein [bacterium]